MKSLHLFYRLHIEKAYKRLFQKINRLPAVRGPFLPAFIFAPGLFLPFRERRAETARIA
jgi:hypothetical protein